MFVHGFSVTGKRSSVLWSRPVTKRWIERESVGDWKCRWGLWRVEPVTEGCIRMEAIQGWIHERLSTEQLVMTLGFVAKKIGLITEFLHNPDKDDLPSGHRTICKAMDQFAEMGKGVSDSDTTSDK